MTTSDQTHERAVSGPSTAADGPLPAWLGRIGQPPTAIDVRAAARGVDDRSGWAERRLGALAGWAGRWLPRTARADAAGLPLARLAVAQALPVSTAAARPFSIPWAQPSSAAAGDPDGPDAVTGSGEAGLIATAAEAPPLAKAPGVRLARRPVAEGAAGYRAVPAITAATTGPITPAGEPVDAAGGSSIAGVSGGVVTGEAVSASGPGLAAGALPLAVGAESGAGRRPSATPALVPGAPSQSGEPGPAPTILGLRLYRRMTQPGLIGARELPMSARLSAAIGVSSIPGAPALLLRRLTARSASTAGETLMRSPAYPLADPLADTPSGGAAGDPAASGLVARTSRASAGDSGPLAGGAVDPGPARVVAAGAGGQVEAGADASRSAAAGAPTPGAGPGGVVPLGTVVAAAQRVPGVNDTGSGSPSVWQRAGGEVVVAAARPGHEPARGTALPVAAARLLRRAAPAGDGAGDGAAIGEADVALDMGGSVATGQRSPLAVAGAQRGPDTLAPSRGQPVGAAGWRGAEGSGRDRAASDVIGHEASPTPGARVGTIMAVGRPPGASTPPALVWRRPLAGPGGGADLPPGLGGGGSGDPGGPLARLAGGAAGGFSIGGRGATLARRAPAAGGEGSTVGSGTLPAAPAIPVPTAAPALDPEVLAEQVARILARRLEIERERRGGGGQWR